MVVAGLGNPGPVYRDTRHNVGFSVVEAMALRHRLSWVADRGCEAEVATSAGRSWVLMKPQTYMNASGRSVAAMTRRLGLGVDSVVVCHDEYTLAVGTVKLSLQGGDGGHKGVASLLEHLGQGFARFRIGIWGEKPPEVPLTDFVLGILTEEEKTRIAASMESWLDALDLILARGPALAMNQINQRKKSDERQSEQSLQGDLHT